MKLFAKKIILSVGVCTAVLATNITTHVYAQETQTATSSLNGNPNIASAMEAFDKLSPEQQKEQIAQSKKMIDAQMDQMIQNAKTPEQKKQLEANKQKIHQQIDKMAKMSPEERKALIEKAQNKVHQELKNVNPEQLKQLTPQQRAMFERFKESQGVK